MRIPSKVFLTAVLAPAVAAALAGRPQPDNSSTDEEKVYVGILDDAREEAWHGKTGAIERRIVMPAFEKSHSEWRAVTSFLPRDMKWTVAFDGKNLGQVESQASSDEGNADQINSGTSRAKQSISTAAAYVPTVGKPSKEFTGISSLFGLTAVRRPLVVVSEPNYSDPDHWKRTRLPEEIVRLVREGFRRQYPHVDRCEEERIVEHDWQFPDSALSLSSAYASNKNSFLIAVSLNAGDCGWGGRPDDPSDAFVHQWFYVAADRSIRRIGGFDELLDAGDYDHDGSSELIFFSTRSENSDAYDLLYDNFRKRVDLVIGYR
jgi:hypothetical protein